MEKNHKNSKLKSIKANVYEYNPAIKFQRRDQILLTRLRIGHTYISHQHIQ